MASLIAFNLYKSMQITLLTLNSLHFNSASSGTIFAISITDNSWDWDCKSEIFATLFLFQNTIPINNKIIIIITTAIVSPN